MNKVSLVTRRRDKAFDAPTKASERARQRLAENDTLAGQKPAVTPPSEDVHVSMEEGSPTVMVDLPEGKSQAVQEIATELLHGKDRAEAKAIIAKERIGDRWELKVQFVPEQASKMLTPKQLAQILGVSPQMVYSLRKKGTLKGYQIGRKWRFVWAEVLEMLEAHKGKI